MKIFLPVIFCFLLLIVLQIHNVQYYPLERGFDARAHLEYIAYLRSHHSLPLPRDGWEFFQPPFYYVVSSLLPPSVNLKLIGLVGWLFFVWIIWRFLFSSQQQKDRLSQRIFYLAIFVFTISLPVMLYASVGISNEFTNAVVVTATLFYYIRYFLPGLEVSDLRMQKKFLLGFLLTIAVLSKATSLLLVVSILVERAIANKHKLKLTFRQLYLPFLLVTIFGGWFYLRSWILYKNFLYQPADYIRLVDYAQPIVPRDFVFFTRPDAFLKLDLFAAHHYSFLAGTYFSFFYDGHGVLLPVQPFSKAGSMIIALSVPFFLISIIGFLQSCRQMFFFMRSEKNSALLSTSSHQLLLIYTCLLFLAYIHYNFRLPLYSTVKSVFLSSLVLPFCYFCLKGAMLITHKLSAKKKQIIFASFLLVCASIFVLVATKHFWVDPSWYKGR